MGWDPTPDASCPDSVDAAAPSVPEEADLWARYEGVYTLMGTASRGGVETPVKVTVGLAPEPGSEGAPWGCGMLLVPARVTMRVHDGSFDLVAQTPLIGNTEHAVMWVSSDRSGAPFVAADGQLAPVFAELDLRAGQLQVTLIVRDAREVVLRVAASGSRMPRGGEADSP